MFFLDFPSLCSPSSSYLINYKIQSSLYNWLDEVTEETEWLRLQGISVWCASSAITSVLRTVAIAEVFFKGAGTFLSSPLSDNFVENAGRGLHEIFVHTTKNILRTAFFPVEFLDVTIFTLIEPKAVIMEITECMRTNLAHAKAGTIHTSDHKGELFGVQGNVKPRFMKYQRRMSLRLHIKDISKKPEHNKLKCVLCKDIAKRGQDLGKLADEEDVRKSFEQ